MFKISIVDTPRQRKLVVEGKLVNPWTADVENTWRQAAKDLQGRSLIVDLRNVTLIGPDGEATLFSLMRDGAEFLCGDVLTKHVLKRLSQRCRCEGNERCLSVSTELKRRSSTDGGKRAQR